jgi:hypothetical protein
LAASFISSPASNVAHCEGFRMTAIRNPSQTEKSGRATGKVGVAFKNGHRQTGQVGPVRSMGVMHTSRFKGVRTGFDPLADLTGIRQHCCHTKISFF